MTSGAAEDEGKLEFARRLAQARDRNGLTQNGLDHALEKRLGTVPGAYKGRTCKYEAGQVPRRRTLSALAEVLGVSVEWLLIGTDRPPRTPPAALREVDAPAADKELVAAVAAGAIGALSPDTVARLLDEAAHFRRVARDCIELDFAQRGQRRRRKPRST